MTRSFIAFASLALCLLVGCDTADDLVSIQVEIVNDTFLETHIFHDTESFSPSNRIAPLGTRHIIIDILPDAGTPQIFTAGRNGQVIATISCRERLGSQDNEYTVYFNRDGTTMRCVGW